MPIILQRGQLGRIVGTSPSPAQQVGAGEPPDEGALAAAVGAKLASARDEAAALGIDPKLLGLDDNLTRKLGMKAVPLPLPGSPGGEVVSGGSSTAPAVAAPSTTETGPSGNPDSAGFPPPASSGGRLRVGPDGRPQYVVPKGALVQSTSSVLSAEFQKILQDPVKAVGEGVYGLANSMASEIIEGITDAGDLTRQIATSPLLAYQSLEAMRNLKNHPDSVEARAEAARIRATLQYEGLRAKERAFNVAQAGVAVAPFGKPIKLLGMGAGLLAPGIKGSMFRLANRALQGGAIGTAYGYFSTDGDWEASREAGMTMGALFGVAPALAVPLKLAGKGVAAATGAVARPVGKAVMDSPAGPVLTGLLTSTESVFRKNGMGDLADGLRTAAQEHTLLAGTLTRQMEENFRVKKDFWGRPKYGPDSFTPDDINIVAGLIEREIAPRDLPRMLAVGEAKGTRSARELIDAAAREEIRLKEVGRLIRAYGIPTYNTQTGELQQFILKKGYIPHVIVDAEQFATNQTLRADAIKQVRKVTKKSQAEAEEWLNDFVVRARRDMAEEASTGTVGRSTMEARMMDLPGYSTDLPTILTRYYARTSKMIANHRRFGRGAPTTPPPAAVAAATPEPTDPAPVTRAAAEPQTLTPVDEAPASGANLTPDQPAAPPQAAPGPVAIDENVSFSGPNGPQAGRVVGIEDAGTGSAYGPLYRVKVPGKKEPVAIRESDLKLFRPGTAVEETMLERRARLAEEAAAPTPEQQLAAARPPVDQKFEAKKLGWEIEEAVKNTQVGEDVARALDNLTPKIPDRIPIEQFMSEIGPTEGKRRIGQILKDIFTPGGARSLVRQLLTSETGALKVKALKDAAGKMNLEEVGMQALKESGVTKAPAFKGFDDQVAYLEQQAKKAAKAVADETPEAGDFYIEGKGGIEAFVQQEFPEVAAEPGGMEIFKLAWAVQNIQKDVPQSSADALLLWRSWDPATKQFGTVKPNGKGYGLSDPMIATINTVLKETGSFQKAFEYLTEPIVKKSRVKIGGKNEWLYESTYRGSEMFGPKIGRFWGPLVGFPDEPVVDIWHIRQFRRMLGEVKFEKKMKAGKEVVVDKGATAGELVAFRAVMRNVTKTMNEETGGKLVNGKRVPYTVSEVQALLWDSERNLWNRIAGRNEPNIFPGEALRMAKEKFAQ